MNVTVLCGGISAEREISLQSGKQVADALTKAGHKVFVSDISPEDLSALDHQPCDVVFPMLHGVFGEDGQVQQFLEERELDFVGSDSVASRNAMDKPVAKEIMLENKIPTPYWQIVHKKWFNKKWKIIPELVPHSKHYAMVKPISEGSSVGCKKCLTSAEIFSHLEETLTKYDVMMIEHFIDGLELTVGILDGEALPVIWIRPQNGLYDTNAKYYREDTLYQFNNIPLGRNLLDQIQALAKRTYYCLGCRHFSRVDIMVQKGVKPFVLEINTIPGFTDHSLLPKAAAKWNISMPSLCNKLVHMAKRDSFVRR